MAMKILTVTPEFVEHWETRFRATWLTLGISVVMIALQLFPPEIRGWLAFERSAVEAGQYWRLLTAMLIHTNAFHLMLNLVAWWVIGYFSVTALRRWRLVVVTLLCGLGSNLGVFLVYPNITRFVGLSGALHGVLIYALLREWQQNRGLMTLILAGTIAKIVSEQITGGNPYVAKEIGARILIEGHLTGAISGLVLALITLVVTAATKRDRSASH